MESLSRPERAARLHAARGAEAHRGGRTSQAKGSGRIQFQASPDERPEAEAEREKRLEAVQEKLKLFNDKAQKLCPAMFKGQPQLEWHGHVWLYRREPAKAE